MGSRMKLVARKLQLAMPASVSECQRLKGMQLGMGDRRVRACAGGKVAPARRGRGCLGKGTDE